MTGKQSQLRAPLIIDLAIIERELERTFLVRDLYPLVYRRDADRESVKLRDVIDAQVIVRANLDDLPRIGRRRAGGEMGRHGRDHEQNWEPLHLHQNFSRETIIRARKIDDSSTMDNRNRLRI